MIQTVDDLVPIENAPGYFVNQYGQVYRMKESGVLRELKWCHRGDSRRSYVEIIDEDGARVRRTVANLVYEAFIGPLKKGLEWAIPIDGDDFNCHFQNLKKEVLQDRAARTRAQKREEEERLAEEIYREIMERHGRE